MKTFNVMLTRAYRVQIEAEDENSAIELVEFYLGDSEDKSNEIERAQHRFNILEIEMTMNEAFEAEEVEK
jgi:hypothetical protein